MRTASSPSGILPGILLHHRMQPGSLFSIQFIAVTAFPESGKARQPQCRTHSVRSDNRHCHFDRSAFCWTSVQVQRRPIGPESGFDAVIVKVNAAMFIFIRHHMISYVCDESRDIMDCFRHTERWLLSKVPRTLVF